MSDAEIVMQGEFLPDGSCRVSADGHPTYAPGQNARTHYDWGHAGMVAPDGWVVHDIVCAPLSRGTTGYPETHDGRMFFLRLYARPGQLAAERRYAVRSGDPGVEDSIGIASRADVALFEPRFGRGPASGFAVFGGTIYVTGVAGAVSLTAVDSTHVVGQFEVRGRREWSW